MANPRSPFEHMSTRKRKSTPMRFALHLYHRVAAATGCSPIAVLWVQKYSIYYHLWPAVEPWGTGRNALAYAGPWPCICHPPCGPWGSYHHISNESKIHGIAAVEHVHKWGGIVEHPASSRLFREFGLPSARLEKLNQSMYGFPSPKPTLLYICL